MAISFRHYSLPMTKDAPKLEVPEILRDHPLFAPGQSIGMVTAENPKFPVKTQGGNEKMLEEIRGMGLEADLTEGKYDAPERTFLVKNPTREQMIELGSRYGQESVVFSKDGKHQIIYTNGPNVGHYNPGHPGCEFFGNNKPPEDNAYTMIPGKGNVRLHFDWDKLLPIESTNATPKAPDAPQPTAKPDPTSEQLRMSECSSQDICSELAKTIRKRIDIYSNELLQLRKREMNLSKSETCPMCGNLDMPGKCTCLSKAEPPAESLHEKPTLPGKPVPVKTGPKATKSEDFIDVKNANEPGKRLKNVGAAGVTPDDKKSKKVGDTEGTGGSIKKEEVPMAKPPSGGSPQAGAKPPSGVATNKPAPMGKAALPMRSAKNAGAEAASYARPGAAPATKPVSMASMAKPASAFENITPDASAAPSGLELDVKPAGKKVTLPGLGSPKKDVKPAAPVSPILRSPLAGNSRLTPKTMAIATSGPTQKSELPMTKSEMGKCPLCKKCEHPGKCE